ncbi:MAG: 50S ribosomal protein L11 methyltransferase [Ferruginibacter sp.]
MEYTAITFENIEKSQSELFVALLADIGFEGFEEESKSLKAFIKSTELDELLFNKVIDINNFKYSKSIIKQQNWNEKWEADFEPVKVFHPTTNIPFAYIRANFHKVDPAFLYDISVTPKMSFGTGHHATTHLMVAHMSEIDFKNKSVIDFGTGTGVLAILAEKMGAEKILAIDNDEWSITNAKENIEVNKCTGINILQAETIPEGKKADIILANINLNIIKANIDAIKNAASFGTVFLFSGIMLHDEEKIIETLKGLEIIIKHVFKKENWLSILAVI